MNPFIEFSRKFKTKQNLSTQLSKVIMKESVMMILITLFQPINTTINNVWKRKISCYKT